MLTLIRKRMRGEKGFTLIELLVVIIIIAILAAIAIPTFLGQRQKAQDAAAKSLVRNAMTALESAYVDNRSYDVDDAGLSAIEPSITWLQAAAHVVDVTTPDISATALADDEDVDYYGEPDAVGDPSSEFSIASVSASGNTFGCYTDKGPNGETTFVKVINGEASLGW